MTTAATQYPLIGSQPVGNFFTPDETQRHPLGAEIAFDDPYWGGGVAKYLAIPVSTAFKVGAVVTWDANFNASAMPNSANTGYPVGFALNANASDANAAQYGWFAISGNVPVLSNASVAAGAQIGIAAAGEAGANSAGKQLLGVKVNAAATTTVAKSNVTTTNGSPVLKVAGPTDGWFVGMALSGTGIPAATVVSAIGPDNLVTMSANATATGSVTVTGTYNDGTSFWNVCAVSRPIAQGAIT